MLQECNFVVQDVSIVPAVNLTAAKFRGYCRVYRVDTRTYVTYAHMINSLTFFDAISQGSMVLDSQ